jgi:hypothetical protein
MAWTVIDHTNKNDHLIWPYNISDHEWRYIIIDTHYDFSEVYSARSWCEENSILYRTVFSGLCFKTQDDLLHFILRWS